MTCLKSPTFGLTFESISVKKKGMLGTLPRNKKHKDKSSSKNNNFHIGDALQFETSSLACYISCLANSISTTLSWSWGSWRVCGNKCGS